jgi:hypothetical protein
MAAIETQASRALREPMTERSIPPMTVSAGLSAACSGEQEGSGPESLTHTKGPIESGSYPPARKCRTELTREEEQVLMEHLPIVRFLARRIHERLPQHVDIEDLFSAGLVGLMDAFTKFDPAKKVQFRSYAQFRIRGAILDSLRTLDWSPRELRRKGRAIEEAIRMLMSRLGYVPSESEMAPAWSPISSC